MTRERRIRRLQRLTLSLSLHWLSVVITALALYVALSFAAPTLMHLGLSAPAEFIYRLYGPFCHQFAFRSFFLYGKQPVYPRAVSEARGTSLEPFETYAVAAPAFQARYAYWYGVFNDGAEPAALSATDLMTMTPWLEFAAKDFYGTPEMGYKTALCQRDIAIYSAMLLGALLYSVPFVRRRLRPAPLWLFAFVGLGPIAIDGMSQLISYPPFEWWPVRETQPAFRAITGALFGLMFAWFFLPRLERSFNQTARQLARKLASASTPQPELQRRGNYP